jgi:hypothetical protein
MCVRATEKGEGMKEARCGRSMGQHRICGRIMITGLFKTVEQILAGKVFEKERKE